jgi:hypothetical protein
VGTCGRFFVYLFELRKVRPRRVFLGQHRSVSPGKIYTNLTSAASGSAIANGVDSGLLKIVFFGCFIGPSVLFIFKAPFFVSFLREMRGAVNRPFFVLSIEMGASSRFFLGLFPGLFFGLFFVFFSVSSRHC